MQTGPALHQADGASAVESLHQELEQDAIACYPVLGRVRAVRPGEGERRGNGLAICDQRIGTIVEHGVQRRQRSFRLGRLKHLHCNILFVQCLNARKVVQYAKVPGIDSFADVCITGFNPELMTKHVPAVDG